MEEVLKMDALKDLRKKLEDPTYISSFIGATGPERLDQLQKDFGLNRDQAYALAKEVRDVIKGMEANKEKITEALSKQ